MSFTAYRRHKAVSSMLSMTPSLNQFAPPAGPRRSQLKRHVRSKSKFKIPGKRPAPYVIKQEILIDARTIQSRQCDGSASNSGDEHAKLLGAFRGKTKIATKQALSLIIINSICCRLGVSVRGGII